MVHFEAVAEPRARGAGVAIRLPFDPAAEWGERDRYDVAGTINGHRVRGKLTHGAAGEHVFELRPGWQRDTSVVPGAKLSVVLDIEGPQVGSMGPDMAAALDAEPAARRFFESLPTFYRKNFARWIDQAKRPETRARRIAETIATLKAGQRER